MKRVFDASDLPEPHQLGGVRAQGLLRGARARGPASPPPPCAGSPRTGPRTLPTWARHPGIRSGGKGLQTQSGKIEFMANSLARFYASDGVSTPSARCMGPQYMESWEGHHTKELYEKYPLAMVSPHPRFTFHTMGDGKGAWSNEIKDHRVLVDGHYYWIMRLNAQDAAARGIEDGDLCGPSTTGPRSSWPRRSPSGWLPAPCTPMSRARDYLPLGEPGHSAGHRRLHEHAHLQALHHPHFAGPGAQLLPCPGGEVGGAKGLAVEPKGRPREEVEPDHRCRALPRLQQLLLGRQGRVRRQRLPPPLCRRSPGQATDGWTSTARNAASTR